MATKRVPSILRRLAAFLIGGPESAYILTDLEDTFERELARGMSVRRAQWRYAVNAIGSAWSATRIGWRISRFEMPWLDLRLGVRMMAKHPGMTAVVVLALAVGIPAGLVPRHFMTALHATLPFDEGHRIMMVRHANLATARPETPSLYDFTRWRETSTTFASLGAAREEGFNLNAEDRAEPISGAAVTASTFDMLRVRPLLGRTLVAADETMGAPDVVVIGYDVWQSRLGADSGVVGRVVRIGDGTRTVVGVMPPGFLFPERQQLWIPWRERPRVDDHRRVPWMSVFGRLRDDTSMEEAEAELAAIGLGDVDPEVHARLQPEVVPYPQGRFNLPKGGFRTMPGFYAIEAMTLLLLVVACANVSMLILARSASRAGELAVRTALGASRTRIVSQLFTEALVIAVVGAGLGLLLADQVSRRFDWMENMMPFWVDLAVKPRTVVWAFGLAILSAVVVSVVPALKVTGRAVQRSMQQAAARRSGVRFGGLSSALLIADVTLAVATVGLAMGLWNWFTVGQGGMDIRADRYLAASFRVPRIVPQDGGTLSDAEFAARVTTAQRELLGRLAEEPGVHAVAMGSRLPGMDHSGRRVEVDGANGPEEPDQNGVLIADVGLGFFEAFEQPILIGRGFTASDLEGEDSAIIVNTAFVEKVLGGRNPIGRRIRYEARGGGEPSRWYEIVGVVGPLGMYEGLPGLFPGMYHPLAPGENDRLLLAILVGENPTSFTPRLRAVAAEVDPTAILSTPVPLDEVFSMNAYTVRWAKLGAGALIAILVGLAVSGIYALMSFTVSQRTRELGIRSALGAQRNTIAVTVVRRAVAQLAIGVSLGMPIAGRLLFEMRRVGPTTTASPVAAALLAGAGVMVVIGLLACTAPTVRAVRIPPTEALKG